MKKSFLLFAVLLAAITNVFADNTLIVPAVTIPQGGNGVINIELNNDKAYTAFTMKLTLPKGITYDSYVKSSRFAESHSVSATPTDQIISFGCLSTSNESIAGNSGTLLQVNIAADAELTVGTTLTAVLSNADFSTTSGEETLADVNISIVIGEPADTRTVLDENSAVAPTASDGAVDVLVKRTIKAGNWSTICLPFAMTEAQVKSAFGNDVQLADFTGYDTTEDADENIVGITVNFAAATAIEANHPYIIKVSSDVAEFSVNEVEVNPGEATVAAIKRGRKQWSEMTGVYEPTTIDENVLVLSNNKFYYSTGNTKMKPFRAYFDFYDVLTEVENASANSRIRMSFGGDGNTTKIKNVDSLQTNSGRVYSIKGQFMGEDIEIESLPKGLYIVNGKKIVK